MAECGNNYVRCYGLFAWSILLIMVSLTHALSTYYDVDGYCIGRISLFGDSVIINWQY